MAGSPSIIASISPTTTADDVTVRARLSEIDRSMRLPALFFLTSALLWLLAGTFLALLASITLHSPEFFPNTQSLTFGIVRSAHLNAMAYGWANNAVFAVLTWIMARLCRTRIRHKEILITAGVFWNIGVTIGIIGILRGDMTSVEWLEMPPYVAPILALSFAMVGVWNIIAFRFRQSDHIYVSQWYILGAMFWLPWLYCIAQMMILWEPSRGVVQAVTNWWFAHNFLGLWLTPAGLAAIYYLLPKVLGVPIHSYYLSIVGFWSLALFYNWAGVHHLIGGPIPAWLITVGIIGSVMMVIPVVVTGINHHMTAVGHFRQVWVSPTLRFIVFGAVNYTLVSLAGSSMALRDVNEVTHFTHLTIGHAHHGVYAFFTMVMFGAIYFMLPRLMYREWPSAMLIHVHFWCTAVGILLMMAVLHIGGWIQGMELNALSEGTPVYTFIETMQATKPWLHGRSLSGVLLAVGHIAFFINFVWMVFLPTRADRSAGPTLFVRPEAPAR